MTSPLLSIGRQFVIAIGALALLLFPWPGLEEAYSACFRFFGEFAFNFIGFEAIEFRRQDQGFSDILILVHHDVWNPARAGATSVITGSSQHTGYLPTAIFLAFWCGTALGRPDRWRTFFLGSLLVHAFIASEVASLLLWSLTSHAREFPTHDHMSFLNQAWWEFYVNTQKKIFLSPIVRTTVPVLILAAVALRAEQYVRVDPGLKCAGSAELRAGRSSRPA